jgi:hypothetical protein
VLTRTCCGIVLILLSAAAAQAQSAVEAEIVRLDGERCNAITEGNMQRLAELFADAPSASADPP